MKRLVLFFGTLFALPANAQTLTQITDAEVQPLLVQVNRVAEALDQLGTPLGQHAHGMLDQAARSDDPDAVQRMVQQALDPNCVMQVSISPESRVKVAVGPAEKVLDQNGWRVFLIKVINRAGSTAALRVQSSQSGPVANAEPEDVRDRWLGVQLFDGRPLSKTLSGISLEYRPVLLYSRDEGRRSAVIAMDVGQGTQDLGFRNDVLITFECRPTAEVRFSVRDVDGKPTTAAFEIRDELQRVYPNQAKRLAPDFFFQPQIYRGDGEVLRLPPQRYHVRCTRGPEYFAQELEMEVTEQGATCDVKLKRWVDPSHRGWWSGDHHIHAAGCAHYAKPTEGVHASDMLRHCQGEDLKIGANLTWGPCFDYQKQFFTGKVDPVSKYPYLLRYDVEVSGFGSHQSGHLCLLRLRRQIPVGGDSKHHWPTLCLNTLKWAQQQGAVCGPAHSGWGLDVDSDELPNYVVPPFSGIGANEYIVDVTHRVKGPDGSDVSAVDFLSLCDTPYVWELNIWYHTLNCGFRTRASGETDFPCIYGERVGLGRSYVKMEGRLDYDRWCEGISRGACYVSDGRSHIMDFQVNRLPVGREGSELRLGQPTEVTVEADVAALLQPHPDPGIRDAPYTQKPYWHIERARIGDTREVAVELVVNGFAVEQQNVAADGRPVRIAFETEITRSSWVALRILPSSHTNPVFVLVGDKPIRASRRSAQWCLDGVKKCWTQKEKFIARSEMQQARDAYAHAQLVYETLVMETTAE